LQCPPTILTQTIFNFGSNICTVQYALLPLLSVKGYVTGKDKY